MAGVRVLAIQCILRAKVTLGRCLSLQVSGWVGISELSQAMQIPEEAVLAIAVGSMDFKGYNRFVVREENGQTFIRPYYYEGSRAMNQQSW